MNELETRVSAQLHERAALARPDDCLGDVLDGGPSARLWPRDRAPFTPEPSRRHARMLVGALGLAAVVAGGIALASRSGDEERVVLPAATGPDAPRTSGSTTAPSTLGTAGLPEDVLPEGSVLLTAITTTVGEIRVYAHPDADQTCLFVFEASGTTGSCFAPEAIDAGDAYFFAWERPGVLPGFVAGLAPADGEFAAVVAGREVVPDEHRIWYAEVPVGLAEITINGADGSRAVPIPADPPVDVATLNTVLPSTTAPRVVISETLRQLQYRADLASSRLEALGFPNNESSTGADGVMTIVAFGPDQSRTVTITMTPGAMLLPENHVRAPITTTENTADRISMEYNSNNGWRFTLVAERTGTVPLPSEDELGNLLYGIDP